MELSHFAIAKFLQEQYDCNMFAIIDFVDHAKKFFLNQQLVKFQKVWYIRDHILKPHKGIDIEYLVSFEKKYNINLWNLAYSERYFYQFNAYYKFSSDEILSLLEQNCKFFEMVLDEIKPVYIIMRMTDDHQTQLLHEICKAKNIRILTWSGTRFGYHVMISESSDIPDIPFVPNENYHDDKIQTFEELLDYTKKYPEQLRKFSQKAKFSSWDRFKTSLKFFISIYDSNYRKYFRNFGRTRIKIIIHEGSLSLKKSYREFFINKNSLRYTDKSTPFVYFPIHFEPERAISIPAPFYTNQLEVITHIAKSLPVGYKLFVKEHPLQYLTGWKNTSFYKKILELPNVCLIHTSVSSEELMKNCSLVITIAGTTGLEAAFYNKPVIVFTDTIYSNLSHVYRVRNLEDIPNAIHSSLKKKVNLSELNQFVNYIMKNSVIFDELGINRAIAERFYLGGFLGVDIPIDKMKSFLEEYCSAFEPLVTEYVKKINQFKSNKSSS